MIITSAIILRHNEIVYFAVIIQHWCRLSMLSFFHQSNPFGPTRRYKLWCIHLESSSFQQPTNFDEALMKWDVNLCVKLSEVRLYHCITVTTLDLYWFSVSADLSFGPQMIITYMWSTKAARERLKVKSKRKKGGSVMSCSQLHQFFSTAIGSLVKYVSSKVYFF